MARRGWGRTDKLPSGRYRARYVGPDTRTHSAPHTFATKRDAEGWLSAEYRLISADTWTPPKLRKEVAYRERPTLAEFADEWLPTHRKSNGEPIKARTLEHYRRLLDRQLVPILGPLRLDHITEDVVNDWHAAQGDKTPTQTAHAYSLLHLLLDAAVEAGHITVNPARVKGGTRAKTVHNVRPLTLEQLETIVENMPPDRRAAILLMAWCGLRFGECTELRRRDLDLNAGVVHVDRAVVLVGGRREVTTPKSAAGVRTVTIPPHILPAIREHVDRYAAPGPDGLLFVAPKGGGHVSQSTLNGHVGRRRLIKGRKVLEGATGFCRAREEAGRPDIHIHDLRHFGATMAARAGATLAELQSRIGHSTVSAAMRYQHAAADRDAQVAAAMSRLAARQPDEITP